ncbi:MAG: glycine/sarcosine/betaine reductase component B subunit, partial [Candidatus Adiutrix sp.]|nr:glycine/sarcosine/betaine reductase component B subunit [Candidatus Adiutrix sp.]
MRLELHKAKVRGLALDGPTRLENGLLHIDKEEALKKLLLDRRFAGLDLDLASPGDSTRIIPVKDAIEPRVKLSGGQGYFPG